MLNRIIPSRPRSGSRRSEGSFVGDDPATPQMSDEDQTRFASGSGPGGGSRRAFSNMSSLSNKLSPRALLATPSIPARPTPEPEGIPKEMIPALTLLAAHGSRVYIEGYFMLLAELDSDGQPLPNPKWVEVFGVLQGTVITMWDASLLEQGRNDTSFINVGDGYMRSVEALGDDLQNIIVLSTTMKNRYLLQFGTKKLFNEWTAALRLSAFERTSLQEAYTGALLSAKGSQLHGIRSLLQQTKYRKESWCQVRFGVGMPWRHVWAVIIPNAEIKEKKDRRKRGSLGKVELYEDPKDVKKKKSALATIDSATAAFAVFPEKSVLVDVSSLIKLEGYVLFQNEPEPRETAVFLMPDPHPGIEGYETLIRFLIPVLDIFGLYGRPTRLNADKNDIKSLLFGMPTLPRAHYLDVIDVFMLATLPESEGWAASEWNARIKELIARKMAMGFRGTGSIGSGSGFASGSEDSSSHRNSGILHQKKPRAISDPHVAKLFATPSPNETTAASSSSSLNKKYAPAVPSPLQHSRPAPKAPYSQSSQPPVPSQLSQPFQPKVLATQAALPQGNPSQPGSLETPAGTPAVVQVYPKPAPKPYFDAAAPGQDYAAKASGYGAQPQSSAAPPITATGLTVPQGPRPGPEPPQSAAHNRTKSEGGDRIPGLLTPQLGDDLGSGGGSPGNSPPQASNRNSRPTLASADSFESAVEGSDLDFGLSDPNKPNLFDPTYRPAHQSYADYSDYMKQYLNRTLGNGEAISASPGLDSNAGSGPVTPRAASGGGAKLLDTPIRTPELTAVGDLSLAGESAGEASDSPPDARQDGLILPKPLAGVGAQRRPSGPRPDPTQSPQEAGARIPAPISPGRAPLPGILRAESPTTPTENGQSRLPAGQPVSQYSQPPINPYLQHPQPPPTQAFPVHHRAGGAAPMDSSASPSNYPIGPGPAGPPQVYSAPGTAGSSVAGPGGMPMPNGPAFHPVSRGSPDRRGSPGLGPRPMPGGPMPGGPMFGGPTPGGPMPGGPMPGQAPLPPQMRMRVPSPGSYGAPGGYPQGAFGGPLGSGRGTPPIGQDAHMSPYTVPPAGYGGPPQSTNPFAPPRPMGGMPAGAGVPTLQAGAKSNQGPRALNEVRAQQLRDTRAQTKNNGGYPSFK